MPKGDALKKHNEALKAMSKEKQPPKKNLGGRPPKDKYKIDYMIKKNKRIY